ncbi:MAG: hypothetical protein ABSH08_02795 [Tepidisphaeraceae bacterium]|jgi:hypothetical protein
MAILAMACVLTSIGAADFNKSEFGRITGRHPGIPGFHWQDASATVTNKV